MRHMLMAISLGLAATTVLANVEHAGSTQHEPQPKIDRTIEVMAGDFWFKPDDLSIAPGDTVEFVIENTGKVEHEFVIGAAGEQEEHREMMLDMASSGDDHHDMSAHHHGEGDDAMPSVTVASGETKTLVWTATDTVDDTLIYACNIPGHFEAGMHGKLAAK